MELSKKVVKKAHKQGGSILGTARGGGDVDKIVDSILRQGINMLFVIGGTGRMLEQTPSPPNARGEEV